MVQLDLDCTPTLSFAQLVLQFGGARCPDREAFWYCSQLSKTALKWWNMLTSDAQYGTALVMVHKYVEQHATWAMQFVCFLFLFFLFMLFMYYSYRLACAVQKAEVIINRTSSH